MVISMKIKRLIAFWFKTLHMWRLSVTSIVGIQPQFHGFQVQRNHCIQKSSGGLSGHINVNHYISNHLFQNSTTAEIIRHKFSFSRKAAKNSCIFHTVKFTSVHIRNYYSAVASDHPFKACRTTQRQATVGFDEKKHREIAVTRRIDAIVDDVRCNTDCYGGLGKLFRILRSFPIHLAYYIIHGLAIDNRDSIWIGNAYTQRIA